MSLSGAHRAAFRREAAQQGQVFAIRDPEGFPAPAGEDGRRRWDGQDLRAFTGTYGDYLLGKVSRVFPQLRQDVL